MADTTDTAAGKVITWLCGDDTGMSSAAIQVTHIEEGAPWPSGISDGLACSCAVCGKHTDWDCMVTDEFWRRVATAEHRTGVICLSCLDRLADAEGLSIVGNLVQVQFTGRGKTIILKPVEVYTYAAKTAPPQSSPAAGDGTFDLRAALSKHRGRA